MQQNQDPQSTTLSGPTVTQNTTPSIPAPAYYSEQAPPPHATVNDGQMPGSIQPLNGGYPVAGTSSGSTVAATNNAQLQSYTQQQQQQPPPGPSNGGTWTGPNTLTYTQSMQPPGTTHANYCEW